MRVLDGLQGRRAVAVVSVLAITCGVLATSGVAVAGGEPAPKGLPKFYAVPSKLPSKPGALIKSEKVDAPKVDGTVYRVMYTTETEQGDTRAVTGLIVVPKGTAPKGGWPVVTWAHGTNGMADKCAPSLDPTKDDAVALANNLLAKGWMFTATDYSGEGTPGLHPYIAGPQAARDTIDIVRAAKDLKGADPSDQYVVWGHSQGGHTAMHALNTGADYAPDLELKGVVAGAPPSQFDLLYNFLKTSPFKFYLLMAAGGLNAAYGDKAAPLDKVLSPEGEKLLPVLEQGCSDYIRKKLENIPTEQVANVDPFTVPEWKKLLTADDPDKFTTPHDTPLLIIHGGSDEQIPTASSQLLSTSLCAIGQGHERWVYPGMSHSGVIAPSLPSMIEWMDARFKGDPPGSVTPTGGTPAVEVTGCPASG
jgi:alpha-beta hydrolase superfamily lysophospholipase